MDDEHPDFRATIRPDGSIWLAGWRPWLGPNVPWHTMVASQRRSQVCLADFTLVREDEEDANPELIVTPLTALRPEHREGLLNWASTVGYQRVWVGDEVIEPESTAGGTATTRCRTCGHQLVGKGVDFWAQVHGSGCFPTTCLICGCDVPQWHHAGARDEPTRPRPRVRTSVGGRNPRHDPGAA